MKDVRELIKEAMDSLGIPSACEVFIPSKEKEYVVYMVVSERDSLFADNAPRMLISRVYLYYISTSQNNKLTRPVEIISAMKAKGFRAVDRQVDITSRRREDDFMATGYFGVMQEFLLERWGKCLK